MATKSKAYRAAAEKMEEGKFYTPNEAVGLARETGSKNFNSTVEVALKLGVDPRKADQMVRGTVILPHGTGKTARVIVFATGPAADAAIAAGADEVGGDELIEKVAAGYTSFDFVLKTPPAAELIKKAAGVKKGSGVPHTTKVGKLTQAQVREIAQTKLEDLHATDIDAAMKIVEGTARSMGVTTD